MLITIMRFNFNCYWKYYYCCCFYYCCCIYCCCSPW